MRISSIVAAFISLFLFCSVVDAQAARILTPPPDKGGPPVVCAALCPPPVDTNSSAVNYRACADQLGHLRRVTVRQIEGVGPRDKVHLVPLCDIINRTLTFQQTAYLSRGNVQGLLPAIAGNGNLATSLKGRGYDANDVIGVALGHNIAVLYVSHR